MGFWFNFSRKVLIICKLNLYRASLCVKIVALVNGLGILVCQKQPGIGVVSV